ncbi:hypothetical protein EU811_19650 [Arthrobacter sp. TS-15]|uniref:hypothetical protein n=1 Tax=Arthrobacter sp. TS-15 TaxID=2510797 RepID=UPI00115D2E4B|nr:hypothetical protein [Arthrobacter sp. TS-15]TQS89622.1 hypothetical protein EU811_19650 [Arthrobacter sp. TS-15]
MTISVGALFEQSGLQSTGVVPWGTPPSVTGPGVYVVASTPDPDDAVGLVCTYEPDAAAISALRGICPNVAIDGRAASDEELAARISRFWIPATPILYIGLAGTSVQNRVKQYYSTSIGKRSPHAGGWWLKTMADLNGLYVHFGPAADPDAAEARLLSTFSASVHKSVRETLYDRVRVAPFANVDVRKGLPKRHGLAGYKVARAKNPKSAPSSKPVAILSTTINQPSLALDSVRDTGIADTAGVRIESQVITDLDRNSSNLRIPSRSKFALPASNGFLKVAYKGQQFDARWRVNGSRSGTIGLGKSIMSLIGEPGRSIWLRVESNIVFLES